MAESIANIEADIDARIAADPNLSVELNSTSNIAVYKLWRAGVAFVLNIFQRQQDDYQSNVQTLVDAKQFGTDPWWQQQMLAYQHGDIVQFINNRFQYAAIDPTKQVINLCAVDGQKRIATLKCATLVGGVPQPLTNNQILGAQSYANETRPCGVTPVVQSYPADLLKLFLNIYYDPQGDLPTIQAAVEAAINAYLITLSTTDFNGVLYINRIIDAIQAVTGVIKDQVVVVAVSVKPTTGVYTNVASDYQALSGYFQIDPAFPLSSTLQYVAA